MDKGKRILWITDMNFEGSGYLTLTVPICIELAKLGHEIQILGLGYDGREYDFPFSITPCRDMSDINACVHNLEKLWGIDVIVVAMDLPHQGAFHQQYSYLGKPYVAITPLEEGPLTTSWAMPLTTMNAVFFISELGKQEAIKAGVLHAKHLEVGIDSKEAWRQRLPEEKNSFRSNLGIGESDFVVLTVAENQERKNLSAGFSIIQKLKEEIPEVLVRWVLVTRENNAYGNKLRDLAFEYGITDNLIIYERGMAQKNLWGLYTVADAFLLTSKAEGLGLPVMEAMAVGIPVVATKTGAIPELLGDYCDRGFPIHSEYEFRDVWGNSIRRMINSDMASGALSMIQNPENKAPIEKSVANAREFIETRTHEKSAFQIHNAIMEITRNVQEEPTQ